MLLERSRRNFLQLGVGLFSAAPCAAKQTNLQVAVFGDIDPVLSTWAKRLTPYLSRCWPVIEACLLGPNKHVQSILEIDFVFLTREMIVSWTGQAYGIALAHPEFVSAVTVDHTIHVNSAYVLPRINQTDMVGMMVHETAHVVQNYPAGVCTWMKEGLADYVRYYIIRPYDPGRTFSPRSEVYLQGFAPAAGMLAWIESQHKSTIQQLNSVMQRGGDGVAKLQTITGRSPESLLASYLRACPHAGYAPVT